jgi:uncharacterized protein DUF5063
MKTQSNNSEAADRFGAVAQEFCSAVESASKMARTSLLTEVYRVLPRLINAALNLPSIEFADESDASQEEEQSLSALVRE